MEDFLSGERFEKMAQEYNRKYSRVSVLGADTIDKQKMQQALSSIYDLFCYINSGGGGGAQFDEKANEVYLEVKKLEKVLDIKPANADSAKLPFSCFVAAQKSFSALSLLFDLTNEDNFGHFLPLLKKLISAQKCYFSGF